jgi:ATP-grasp ribosomal peptide maturase
VRPEPTVLVLTHTFDPTADYVVTELNRRGVPVFRCDPGEFPKRLTLAARLGTGWVGSLCLPEREVRLEDIGCAYYRRPTMFDLPGGLSDDVRRWASQEARMGLGGVLSALPRWLNHPGHIAAAEYKPVQLHIANLCGLAVPRTIITNDPNVARTFVAEVGRVVYKPLTPASVADGDARRTVFTTPIEAHQLDASVTTTAHLFQEWIDKAYEVRLTAVDDDLFATRIDAHSAAGAVDWRADYDNLSYLPLADLPCTVRTGVVLMLRHLRLRFGVLDFIVTPDERWVFLEVNPNGQWAWIQDETNQPITSAIADALTREAPSS